MEVLLREEDVVSMVLEFLHSRKLYESALALERETGVLPSSDELMPDHLQYLRRLSLDGEWDNVIFYLEPFTELDEFNSKKLNYLVFRQKYIEILHNMSVNKSCSPKDKDSLKKIMQDIQPHCSREELQHMQGLFESYLQESGSLAASRFQCFKDILEILGPFFELYTSTTAGGEVAGQWIYREAPEQEHTRLESVVTDSLFLNECCQYCRDRALTPDTDSIYSGLPFLSTKMLENRDYDISSQAAVLFWIRSLKHDDLFRQRYEIEDVKIKTEAITRQKFAHSTRDSTDSPRKFSSFTSPVKTQKSPAVKPVQPSLARSAHLPSSTRSDSSVNQLASSSPAHYPHHTTRNFSNNNNNEAEHSGKEMPVPDGTTVPKYVDVNDNPAVNEPFVKVEVNTTEDFQRHAAKQPEIPPVAEISHSPVEKLLRDTSNLPIPNPQDVIEAPVENSYENFLEEKKKRKTEKEQFLKNLEEKEKKNEEIRKLLLQQQQTKEEPAAIAQPRSAQQKLDHPPPNQMDSQRSDMTKLLPQKSRPFTTNTYVPIEYTEDVQAIRAVAFHPSGQVYAVGSNSKTLRICSVPREVTSSHFGSPSDSRPIQDVKGRRSPKTSNVVAKKTNLHKGSVYCAAWNDDGSLIATGSNDKFIKLLGFDILGKTLDETPQEMFLHRGIVREVTFLHESNNLLASAGADGMVYVADCNNRKTINNLAGHTDQVLGLYSWHHGMLASTSQDKTVRLWDVRMPSCVSIIGVGGQEACMATSVCVDNPGRWLAMALVNAKVALYDLKAGKMALEYKCHSDEARYIRFNPVWENLLLSSSYDGTVVLSDVDGLMKEIHPKSSHQFHWKKVAECKNKLIQCKWHPNGEAFASTSVDKTCKLWLKN